MNFLQLCQRTVSESGVGNLQLTAVTNQVGLLAKFVNWTRTAWLEVQAEQIDHWTFLRTFQDFSTSAGKADYAYVNDLALADSNGVCTVGSVDCLERVYPDGHKSKLRFYTYERWLDDIDRLPISSGEPSRFTLDPDGSGLLIERPTPDDAYPLRLHFRRTAQSLAVTTDVPIIAPDFHMVIVWRALMDYAVHDEAPALGRFERNYKMQYRRLLARYKPALEWGVAPIA